MKRVCIIFIGVILASSCYSNVHALPRNRTFSSATDHFRSVATGDWSTLATWESSPDNTTWTAATLVPDNNANTITIRNTHTVTVSNNHDMDQLTIQAGGILFHSGGILTVNDGTGDDIVVQSGGIFTLASNGNGPLFLASATANINTGGMLRLSASGLTFPGVGVNANNFVYQNASALEYTLNLAFASSGVTFFPNADAITIPVFRTTQNLGLIGGNNPTIVNGLYESNGTVTWQGTAAKTFRNGIVGTGNITSDPACGKFIINGGTASLGGTGTLTLPSINGMDIGNSTNVTMASNKSVTGNIALLTNALIILGVYNLTMTGDISGGSVSSHVVTNSTGKLVLNNITGATPRFFYIGASNTTINALAIFNGSGANYGARVETGINPSIRYPIIAINRTWTVTPSATPVGGVNVNFFYNNTDGNAMFTYAPATVQQGLWTGVWNVINTGLTQFGGPTNFQVTTVVNSFGAGIDAPMVIGNIPAILTENSTITLHAQKQLNNALLTWDLSLPGMAAAFTIERSADARNFIAIKNLNVADSSFSDQQLLPGLNYYRIKMKDILDNTKYSNTVAILNASKGISLMSISPNPVFKSNFKLNISAAQKTNMEITITDMQGRKVQQRSVDLIAGFNSIYFNIGNLDKGNYLLHAGNAGDGTKVLRFVIQ